MNHKVRAGLLSVLLPVLLVVSVPVQAASETLNQRDSAVTESADPPERMPRSGSTRLIESSPGLPGDLFHTHGHDHSHETPAIHITDYLLERPDIREAYEAWLEMHRKKSSVLDEMRTTAIYEIGDERIFKVFNIDESFGAASVYDDVEFRLMARGTSSEIWVEVDQIGPGKIDQQVVDSMMEALEERTPPSSVNPDQGIVLNNIDIFADGNPANVPDPQGRGVVKVLVTDVQDGWDPDGEGGFVAGFFNAADLAPRSVNSNSNEAAIIYIDSYPGIYTESIPANPSRPLNVIAHEFQHLIHAGFGNLMLFANEGQSEMAEVLNGYRARAMVFLDEPNEVRGDVDTNAGLGFLRWRSGDGVNVLYDYQRAQLFHGYLFERTDVQALGSLTRASGGAPWVQYQNVLNQTPDRPEFSDVLAEFYVANWVNRTDVHEGIFGYSMPQFATVGINNPGGRFLIENRPWVYNERVRLYYGGAQYTVWTDIEGLELDLDTDTGIVHHVVVRERGVDTRVVRWDGTPLRFDGEYESVALVSVNTVPAGSSTYGRRTFHYTASWDPSELRLTDLTFSGNSRFYDEFPFTTGSGDDRVDVRRIAVRIDHDTESELYGVQFPLLVNPDINAVRGQGTLRVSVTGSQWLRGEGAEALYVPDNEVLAMNEVDFSDLRAGLNYIDLSLARVTLQENESYHVVYEVIDPSDDAAVRFLIDVGSDDETNTNYYPVRTLLLGDRADGGTSYLNYIQVDAPGVPPNYDHKNMVMNTRVLTRVPVPRDFPDIVSSDEFELLPNYPNPFNDGTRIRFNVPVSVSGTTPVRIDLYDVTGRRVQTLLQGDLEAGTHSVAFNASHLSSGVYITRMQAGGVTDTRKITYVR